MHNNEVISVRVPKGTRTHLCLAACRASLEEKREVTWSSLVKLAIERLLQEQPAARRHA